MGRQESPHRSTYMFFFTLCIHISKSRASNCRRALSTIKVARPKPLTLRRGPSTSKNTPAECAYKFCYEFRSYGLFFVLPPRSRPKCPVLYIYGEVGSRRSSAHVQCSLNSRGQRSGHMSWIELSSSSHSQAYWPSAPSATALARQNTASSRETPEAFSPSTNGTTTIRFGEAWETRRGSTPHTCSWIVDGCRAPTSSWSTDSKGWHRRMQFGLYGLDG